jgi:hypothetical protein
MVDPEQENPGVLAENVAIKGLENVDGLINPGKTSNYCDLEKHHPTGSVEISGSFISSDYQTDTSAELEEKTVFYMKFSLHFYLAPPVLIVFVLGRLETG